MIERDQPAYGEEPTVRVPFEAIAEARLMLTDDLIRDALSEGQQGPQGGAQAPLPRPTRKTKPTE